MSVAIIDSRPKNFQNILFLLIIIKLDALYFNNLFLKLLMINFEIIKALFKKIVILKKY